MINLGYSIFELAEKKLRTEAQEKGISPLFYYDIGDIIDLAIQIRKRMDKWENKNKGKYNKIKRKIYYIRTGR